MRWNDLKDSLKNFWSDYKHQKAGLAGIALLIVLIGVALSAPFITNPNIPKYWQTGMHWVTYPKNAPPTWENHFSSVTRAPSKTYSYGEYHLTKYFNKTSGSTIYIIKIPYEMKYDQPPKDIALMGLTSNASTPQQVPVVEVAVDRPSEPGVKYSKVVLISDTTMPNNGSLQLSYLPKVKQYVMYWLYENGVIHLNTYGMKVTPQTIGMYLMANNTLYQYMSGMDTMEVVFGRITTDTGKPLPLEELFTHPKSLKGDYTITIYLTVPKGVSVNFHDFKVYIIGRSYGILGTDGMGRPIAIGLLWGTRVALAIGVSVAVASVLIGIFIGVTSAYLGGWADEAIQRFTEFMMTLPVLPMLILLSLYFGQSGISLVQLVFILVIFGWMGTEKVARSMALQIKEQTYVEAARALGAGTGRVVFKHMVPQLLPYAFANIALSVPGAILAEAGLSFLNLTSKNLITWGRMLSYAHSNGATMNGYWWQVIPPGLAIAVVGLVFVLIGVSLDKVLNPRLRRA